MSREDKKKNALKPKLDAFFAKIGELTKVQRLVICIVTFALIGVAYYYTVLEPKRAELKTVQDNLKQKTQQLKTFKDQANQLPKVQRQMAAKQEEFNIAMAALPDKREIPSLLKGVSAAAQDAGLVVFLFKPEKEEIKDYYKKIPVSIDVEGRYHQITDFFYQIVKLNRIVNIDNVDVKTKKGGSLSMKCRAVTYMFVEKPPEDKNKKRRKKK